MESMGMSSNTSNESHMAVAYSLGKVSNSESNDLSSYKRPIFVDKIKEKFAWQAGHVEDIDEMDRISQREDFYDGTRHLHWYSEYCAKYNKMPHDCMREKNCGWCYSSNSCIHGTEEGPVDKCLPRHFIKREENALK